MNIIQSALQELSTVANNELFALIQGSGPYSADLPKFCNKITSILETFLDPSIGIDLGDEKSLDFLKSTLPALTEAFLRRITQREHVVIIAKMLIKIAKLLAKPASQDIAELCELRNYLLIGVIPPQLKFINSSQFASHHDLAAHLSNEGFFGEFGIPAVAYMGQKMLTFWPDEWQKAVGGIKAVGHFVEWYHIGSIDDLLPVEDEIGKNKRHSERSTVATSTTGTVATTTAAGEARKGLESTVLQGMWLTGRVVGFKRDTQEHLIQVEPVAKPRTASESQRRLAEYNGTPESFAASYNPEGEDQSSPVPSPMPVEVSTAPILTRVDLAKVMHRWVDAEHRHRIPLHPTPTTGLPSRSAASGDALLAFSASDVGHFIRLWWSRYHKYYYGRIVRYDAVNKLHSVTYEDGDSRPYDMTSKDYDLIFPPAEVLPSGRAAVLSDIEASKIVANWHRSLLDTLTSPGMISEGDQAPFQFTHIARPAAATALSVSVYQLAVLDEYFREGGSDAVFQSLTDASQPAPISRILLLHLQLAFHLRPVIGVDRFKELVWDLKEAVPGALFRYEDAQIKELTAKNLNDILALLRDLMLLVVTGSQYVPSPGIKETIEEIRLTFGSSLLVCSQLQKRYLGLSIIKETLDLLLPKLENYMVRRYNAIGVPRTVKSPTRPVSAAAGNSRITTAFMDKWLIETGVVESLFGESLHQDLVARSDCVLIYMASRKVLTEKHVGLIWNASLGVHEAVVRVLHQLILLIVPVLGAPLRNYLFSLMSALPCKEYTEQILLLIKAYTVQALIAAKDEEKTAAANANKGGSSSSGSAPSGTGAETGRKGQVLVATQRQWMGFSVLWQFVQDPAVVSDSTGSVAGKAGAGTSRDVIDEGLIDLAVQLLVELLQEEFKDERELVMQRCLDNINAGRSVPVSLQILRRTLALYPQAPKSWFVLGRPSGPKVPTVGSQIEKLIKNSQLLETLFRDLDAYHRSIVAAETVEGAGMKKSRSGVNLDAKAAGRLTPVSSAANIGAGALQIQIGTSRPPSGISAGRVSQLKGVSERLDFLRFIISWSSVKLSEAQTMLLWNAFGAGANTVETLEKLVVWFNSLINKESKPLCALLGSLAQESDPTETEQRSKLAFLSPQVLALSQQKGYAFQNNSAMANALALLSSAVETNIAPVNSSGTTGASGGAGSGGETYAIFEEGVLVKLFEQHIAKWAFQFEKVEVLSRLLTANLCLKLFLHTNICNRSLKVESDGSWTRVGPLSGLPLLWRIALDATDAQVAHVAIALLIELHHKTGPGKTPKTGESYRASLLRTCFMHLYLSMQSLHREESDSSTAITLGDTSTAGGATGSAPSGRKPVSSSSAEVSTQDDMFHDGNALMKPAVIASRIERLIVTLRLAIHRFYIAPSALCTVRVLTGREETPALTVVLRSTDRVGRLRLKIAEHFKESVECIQLYRTGKSSSLIGIGGSSQEFLDKDELTLQQAKFGLQETITAHKRDAPAGEIGIPVGSTAPQQSQKYSGSSSEVKDLFSLQDLSVNLLQPLNPLHWVSSDDVSVSSDNGIADIAAEIGTGGYELFVLPPFPLVSVIESKLAAADLVQTAEAVLHAPKTVPGRDSPVPVVDATAATADKKARVLEFLTPIVRASPFYIDQLIEVLDGYLAAAEQSGGGGTGATAATGSGRGDGGADLSASVWDILLSLPTHAPLSQQLRDIVFTSDGTTAQLSQLLSPSCPYRLLYSLRILETFLCPTPSQSTTPRASAATAGVQEWAVKFFQMGGAEYVLQLLDTFLAKESSRTATHQGSALSGVKSKAAVEGMPRCDVNAMIIALLSRVLYHLLMADPLFSNWQSASGGSANLAILSAQDSADTVPAGVILCAVDVAALAEQIMGCSLHCAGLWKASQLSEAALKALCENSMMLLFGLLTAVDTGHSILSSTGTCQTWLSTMCVRCSSATVRQAACRRVFEVSASIFHKCADPSVVQEEKRGRLRLYDFLYQDVVTAVDCLASGAYNERVKHGEQVYSLLAALEALRNSPFLIFPQLSSERTMRSSTNTLKSVDSPRGVPVSPSSPRVICPDQPEHQHALIEMFTTKLVQHASSESFHSAQPDGTLVGILRVLLVFANSGHEQRKVLGSIEVTELKVRLIPYLYCNCLFPSIATASSPDSTDGETVSSPVEANTEAVCQTSSSRKLVYALLYRLCESTTENLAQLVEVIGSDVLAASAQKASDPAVGAEQSVELAIPRLPVWNYDPGTLVKEPGAYVGLCNQGGTCYMNSFVQQLFHIPAFHEGLLRINAKADEGELRDENAQLLFQLQVMFGFMKFSQKRYYDTVPFCRAFIDYDGQPVSMSEQKDINEFAGMLFDKLEHNKEAAALLANTIQGKIVYRTRSIETSYRSEREENFYMLTAEVKDKATLEDSLELFTTEELFSGDNKIEDSETGRKVDALRGCAIRTLPSTLIIHLKRFEFDLETMNRKKVNDHIAFPTELDMLPYTEEGLQEKEDQARGDGAVDDGAVPPGDSDGEEEGTGITAPAVVRAEPPHKERRPAGYYQYALKGVVAHVGAIDRGHYYSFIRDPEKTGSGSWLEFNDRSVLPFNPDAIPAECFGGKDEYVNANGVACTRVRENSAYLLVYERIGECDDGHHQEARTRLNSAESVDEANASLRRSLRSLSIDETTPRRAISKPVMKAVSKENAEFQRDRFRFHPLHFAFVWQLQQIQAVNMLLSPLRAPKPATAGHNAMEKIVYRDAEPEEVTLSLIEPHSKVVESSRAVDSAQTALSHLVLVSMRFIVEVLVRARAQNCIHLFVERVEEIVMLDRTGGCALALLKVFSSEGTGAAPAVPSEQDSATAASVSGSYTSRARSRISSDLEQVEQTCHRWLAQMVVFCPHPQTVKAFLRLLLNCVKVAKAAQETETVTGLTDALSGRLRDSLPDSATTKASSAGITYPISPVVDLAEKLLFIAERPQLDYLGCRESFDLKCMFLYQLAGLGIEEKRLLVKLSAIPRMCCAVMALFPTAIKTNEIKLQFATDLVARLILSSRSPTASGHISGSSTSSNSSSPRHSAPPTQLLPPPPRVALQTLDTATFLSRTYLEEAIILNANSATVALQQVYLLVPNEERIAVLDFLAEKVLEALATPSLPAHTYRPFFRVLSELLQGSALQSIFLHQATIAKIATKAQQMSSRAGSLDHEVVFEVSRLLQTLGTASADAHAVVMQLRDCWKSLAGRLASAKRCATSTVANAESSTAVGANTSAQSAGGRNGKVASTSSAFLMN